MFKKSTEEIMSCRTIGRLAVVAFAMTVANFFLDAELRIGDADNIGRTVVFVAQDKGFFTKHGIDAKLEMRQTGRALSKGLKAGEMDFK